ncbi:hypothetical protein EUX98_g3767 [Antrodiella citrinella]|uniref:Uncharacterized protein n=1 Tax=Antrodiella citrinella TaxID=2447956 RepID=A0A4V3XIT6_9APHY|nr:hypothetical protein EUX98_g3767 [Antrodiella citrinella]
MAPINFRTSAPTPKKKSSNTYRNAAASSSRPPPPENNTSDAFNDDMDVEEDERDPLHDSNPTQTNRVVPAYIGRHPKHFTKGKKKAKASVSTYVHPTPSKSVHPLPETSQSSWPADDFDNDGSDDLAPAEPQQPLFSAFKSFQRREQPQPKASSSKLRHKPRIVATLDVDWYPRLDNGFSLRNGTAYYVGSHPPKRRDDPCVSPSSAPPSGSGLSAKSKGKRVESARTTPISRSVASPAPPPQVVSRVPTRKIASRAPTPKVSRASTPKISRATIPNPKACSTDDCTNTLTPRVHSAFCDSCRKELARELESRKRKRNSNSDGHSPGPSTFTYVDVLVPIRDPSEAPPPRPAKQGTHKRARRTSTPAPVARRPPPPSPTSPVVGPFVPQPAPTSSTAGSNSKPFTPVVFSGRHYDYDGTSWVQKGTGSAMSSPEVKQEIDERTPSPVRPLRSPPTSIAPTASSSKHIPYVPAGLDRNGISTTSGPSTRKPRTPPSVSNTAADADHFVGSLANAILAAHTPKSPSSSPRASVGPTKEDVFGSSSQDAPQLDKLPLLAPASALSPGAHVPTATPEVAAPASEPEEVVASVSPEGHVDVPELATEPALTLADPAPALAPVSEPVLEVAPEVAQEPAPELASEPAPEPGLAPVLSLASALLQDQVNGTVETLSTSTATVTAAAPSTSAHELAEVSSDLDASSTSTAADIAMTDGTTHEEDKEEIAGPVAKEYMRASLMWDDIRKHVAQWKNDTSISGKNMRFHGRYTQIIDPTVVSSFPVSMEAMKAVATELVTHGKLVSNLRDTVSSNTDHETHTATYTCMCTARPDRPSCEGMISLTIEPITGQYAIKAMQVTVLVEHA